MSRSRANVQFTIGKCMIANVQFSKKKLNSIENHPFFHDFWRKCENMVIPFFENQQKTNEKTAYSFKGKSPENAKTRVRDVSLSCARKNLRMHGIETPRYRACIRRCMHGMHGREGPLRSAEVRVRHVDAHQNQPKLRICLWCKRNFHVKRKLPLISRKRLWIKT